MTRDNAVELKEEILTDRLKLKPFAKNAPGIARQAVESIPRVDARLAVGLALKAKDDYRLELRVQRRTGSAAERWVAKARNEAQILVVDEVTVPPITNIEASKPDKYFCSRLRPLEIGCSIGPRAAVTGTLGAFVEIKESGKPAVLTNNHVLADYDDTSKRGTPVYQPGGVDAIRRLNNRIGTLSDFVVVNKDQTNYVDAAVAQLDDDIEFVPNHIPNNVKSRHAGRRVSTTGDLDTIENAFVANQNVLKVGRTTGYTEGEITAIQIDGLTVRHPSAGNFVFNNVFEVRPIGPYRRFGDSGDSGALVVLADGRDLSAIGLHFAGGVAQEGRRRRYLSYFCPLYIILPDMQLDWVS